MAVPIVLVLDDVKEKEEEVTVIDLWCFKVVAILVKFINNMNDSALLFLRVINLLYIKRSEEARRSLLKSYVGGCRIRVLFFLFLFVVCVCILWCGVHVVR